MNDEKNSWENPAFRLEWWGWTLVLVLGIPFAVMLVWVLLAVVFG